MRKNVLLLVGVLAFILISFYVTNNYSISGAEAEIETLGSLPAGQAEVTGGTGKAAGEAEKGTGETAAQATGGNTVVQSVETETALPAEAEELEQAAEFTLADLDGNEVSLTDFRGKGVYLNFWATWCKWCKKEMPDMEKIYREYENKDLVILAVSVGEDRKKVAQYIEDNGYTFDVLLDPDKIAAQQYAIKPIPVSLFIDREGRIVYKKLGTMKEDQMRLQIERILQ